MILMCTSLNLTLEGAFRWVWFWFETTSINPAAYCRYDVFSVEFCFWFVSAPWSSKHFNLQSSSQCLGEAFRQVWMFLKVSKSFQVTSPIAAVSTQCLLLRWSIVLQFLGCLPWIFSNKVCVGWVVIMSRPLLGRFVIVPNVLHLYIMSLTASH